MNTINDNIIEILGKDSSMRILAACMDHYESPRADIRKAVGLPLFRRYEHDLHMGIMFHCSPAPKGALR